MHRKSMLARTLDYWTRQIRRVTNLLITVLILAIIVILIAFAIKVLLENILGVI